MCSSLTVAFALLLCGTDEAPFPLRIDAPPKAWKVEEINGVLPHYWDEGAVHVLAWEVTRRTGMTGTRR